MSYPNYNPRELYALTTKKDSVNLLLLRLPFVFLPNKLKYDHLHFYYQVRRNQGQDAQILFHAGVETLRKKWYLWEEIKK